MKDIKYLSIGVVIMTTLVLKSTAQEVLQKDEAVSIALENNFDIRGAKNNIEIAKNNAEITNSGYLPSISGNAAANYNRTDSDLTFAPDSLGNSREISIDGIETDRINAGLRLDYTVFDGFGRKYNYAKLKENYNLSDLQARNVMENTLLNIFNSYYEIARQTQNEINQRQTLDISRERLLRAKYSYDYGQSTQLDVLNAEVDYNNDSINYLTITQQLKNEKHNLNLLLGRNVTIEFQVDTSLIFTQELSLIQLMEEANQRNVLILQQEGNIRNARNDIKIASSAMIPRIGINTNYDWSSSSLAPGNNLSEIQSLGLSLNATLTWNIWDGGISNTRKQNTRIASENQQIIMDQTKLNLERNVSNAWTVYQTALFVMQAQKTNLTTNQRNFDRTQEQYSLGQVTSIVFRQAQFNLLNAQLNYNQARYSAKIAELGLLQLSGGILTAQF
ncbi:MAG: TolC family protein [Reichenbachiella sp.]